MSAGGPVLQSIIDRAHLATAAGAAMIVTRDRNDLLVVAASGGQLSPGDRRPADGDLLSFVMETGQPVALSSVRGDTSQLAGVSTLVGGVPQSVVCVPCTSQGDAVGALALADSRNGGFAFDDIELATLLADIAGATLALDPAERERELPTPADLLAQLAALKAADPSRFRDWVFDFLDAFVDR